MKYMYYINQRGFTYKKESLASTLYKYTVIHVTVYYKDIIYKFSDLFFYVGRKCKNYQFPDKNFYKKKNAYKFQNHTFMKIS